MNTAIVLGQEVIRPSTTPITSSILDHATIGPDLAGFGWQNNAGLWPSYNCLDTLVSTALCPNPAAAKPVKDFAFGSWTPAFEFAVYGGVQCSNVGLDESDMRAEITRVFRLNEGKGVERGLLATRFAAQAASGDPADRVGNVSWPAPVDVSVTGLTGMLAVIAAVGALEGYAATVYAGQPTLHLPRAAATLLASNGVLVWNGDKAFTKSGSKVAIGGGYDDPDAFSDGQMTFYASGEVFVEKSEEISQYAYVLHGDGLNEETASNNNFTDNSQLALAERMFRVAVDCFTAKADVSLV